MLRKSRDFILFRVQNTTPFRRSELKGVYMMASKKLYVTTFGAGKGIYEHNRFNFEELPFIINIKLENEQDNSELKQLFQFHNFIMNRFNGREFEMTNFETLFVEKDALEVFWIPNFGDADSFWDDFCKQKSIAVKDILDSLEISKTHLVPYTESNFHPNNSIGSFLSKFSENEDINPKDLSNKDNIELQMRIHKALRGLIVQTSYNHTVHVVIGVNFGENGNSSFPYIHRALWTHREYLNDKYGLQLDPTNDILNYPLLITTAPTSKNLRQLEQEIEQETQESEIYDEKLKNLLMTTSNSSPNQIIGVGKIIPHLTFLSQIYPAIPSLTKQLANTARYHKSIAADLKLFHDFFKKRFQIDVKRTDLLRSVFRDQRWYDAWYKIPADSFERLEFLGDAVIDFVVTKHLFKHFPYKRECDLSDFRVSLVCNKNLKKCAETKIFNFSSSSFNREDFLKFLGAREDNKVLKEEKFMADLCEATVGAVFVSNGLETAEKFVFQFITKDDYKNFSGYTEEGEQIHEMLEKQKFIIPKEMIQVLNEAKKAFKENLGIELNDSLVLNIMLLPGFEGKYPQYCATFLPEELKKNPKLREYQAYLVNNERLEWFGDCILKLVVENFLFFNYPDADEAELSVSKHLLVDNKKSLPLTASLIGFDKILKTHFSSLVNFSNKTWKKTISNCVEALIAALYLQQGFTFSNESQYFKTVSNTNPELFASKWYFANPSLGVIDIGKTRFIENFLVKKRIDQVSPKNMKENLKTRYIQKIQKKLGVVPIGYLDVYIPTASSSVNSTNNNDDFDIAPITEKQKMKNSCLTANKGDAEKINQLMSDLNNPERLSGMKFIFYMLISTNVLCYGVGVDPQKAETDAMVNGLKITTSLKQERVELNKLRAVIEKTRLKFLPQEPSAKAKARKNKMKKKKKTNTLKFFMNTQTTNLQETNDKKEDDSEDSQEDEQDQENAAEEDELAIEKQKDELQKQEKAQKPKNEKADIDRVAMKQAAKESYKLLDKLQDQFMKKMFIKREEIIDPEIEIKYSEVFNKKIKPMLTGWVVTHNVFEAPADYVSELKKIDFMENENKRKREEMEASNSNKAKDEETSDNEEEEMKILN